MADWDFGYKTPVKYPIRNVTGTFEKECSLEFMLRGRFEIVDETVFKEIEADKKHLNYLSSNIGKIVVDSLRMICGDVMQMYMWYELKLTLPESIISVANVSMKQFGLKIAKVELAVYRMDGEDEQQLRDHDDLNALLNEQGTAGDGPNGLRKHSVLIPAQVVGGPKREDHYPGEKVTLPVMFLTDVNTSVTASGVRVAIANSDGGINNYEFIMPNHDVVVEVNFSGGMTQTMNAPSTDSPMMGMVMLNNMQGMMGMQQLGNAPGMMGMQQLGNAPGMMGMQQPSASMSSVDPWDCACGQKDNRSKFCPNCGAPRK